MSTLARTWAAILALLAGFGLALIQIRLSRASMPTPPTQVHCVTQFGGSCLGGCNACYFSVQNAIDAANSGDEIRIAGGAFGQTGTVARIRKSLTLRGGYSANLAVFNPGLYTTTLDANDVGSVISITNAADVTLQYLTIVHGVGTGNCSTFGCGGGIFAAGSGLTIDHCHIHRNAAGQVQSSYGGGIHARYMDDVNILHSQISDNKGVPAGNYYGSGGGVAVTNSPLHIEDNLISENVGSVDYIGGGALYLYGCHDAEIISNTFRDNQSTQGFAWSSAGALELGNSESVLVRGNRFEGNQIGSLGNGGALRVSSNSTAWIDRNLFRLNSAGTATSRGDAISIHASNVNTLTNNVIVQNGVGSSNGAVYVEGYIISPGVVLMANNTIADNGAFGLSAYNDAIVVGINNIFIGHTTGITDNNDASVTFVLDHNLFWDDADPFSGTNAVIADPTLWGDYRLKDGSPAINQGLTIPWLGWDYDGRPRPLETYFDIGAFEGPAWEVFLPIIGN